MKYRLLMVIFAFVIGCTPHRPGQNASPFAPDEAAYTLGFIFDLGSKYRDRVLGPDPVALRYALTVKDTYFRDRAQNSDRLLIAQVSSIDRAVLWDGKVRTFKKDFPNPTKDLAAYLSGHADVKNSPYLLTYDAVADTFDYLLKFRNSGKMAVLVFSEMRNQSPEPEKARKHLVNSLGAFARARGHCAFYWLSMDTCRELEAIGRDAGLTFGNFIPDAVRDPVRPTFLD